MVKYFYRNFTNKISIFMIKYLAFGNQHVGTINLAKIMKMGIVH